MKKNYIFSLVLLVIVTTATVGQTTITLQPNSEQGLDAFIYNFEPDRNLGTHTDFMASAWTAGGRDLNVRGVIRFNLDSIPSNAEITSAKLSLFSYDSESNGTHSTIDGSNKCLLQRITSSWEEQSVTWNNQPSVTTEHMAILDSSKNEIEDYLDIDVTVMIKYMQNNPIENFGFMLSLETEEKYRRMVFASSDNENSALHPKLEITYIETVGVYNSIQEEPNIYPNPARDFIYVNGLNNMSVNNSVEIFNASGQLIKKQLLNNDNKIEITNLKEGIYWMKIKNSSQVFKFIKE